ncbi:hypothetical protein BCR33DRAFT_315305 [Rhizoclosmatium globosum]|uniref:Uncharacterized protein n=1 Tax=Rhizoclosmatium globosum TaxID=329046 RepID=A0A1Y2CZN7_9FUNG|nr:hypothetical protein BCR33DRAFT_315305 [Rhizoclosmatium globosum]|eukprot:ORY52334.1 hypothetical protein BCR33DRAFT_315305 [Rhizoclosmatium globosum]
MTTMTTTTSSATATLHQIKSSTLRSLQTLPNLNLNQTKSLMSRTFLPQWTTTNDLRTLFNSETAEPQCLLQHLCGFSHHRLNLIGCGRNLKSDSKTFINDWLDYEHLQFSLSDAKPLDGETDEVASIFPDQDFQTPVKIPSPEPPKRFSSEPSKRTSIPLAALPPSPSPIPPTETATPTSTTQEQQNTITPEKLETIQESPVTSPGPIYASVEVIEVVHQAIVAETVVSEPVEYVEPSLPSKQKGRVTAR